MNLCIEKKNCLNTSALKELPQIFKDKEMYSLFFLPQDHVIT